MPNIATDSTATLIVLASESASALSPMRDRYISSQTRAALGRSANVSSAATAKSAGLMLPISTNAPHFTAMFWGSEASGSEYGRSVANAETCGDCWDNAGVDSAKAQDTKSRKTHTGFIEKPS